MYKSLYDVLMGSKDIKEIQEGINQPEITERQEKQLIKKIGQLKKAERRKARACKLTYSSKPKVLKRNVSEAKARQAKNIRCMTTAEQLLASQLTKHHIAFEPQKIMANSNERYFIVDFVIGRLAIEIDGESHKGEEEYDAWREACLMDKYDLEFMRFTNKQILEYPLSCTTIIINHLLKNFLDRQIPLIPKDLIIEIKK